MLGVSEVTIRSDLATLERGAALTRVYGGAVRRQDVGRWPDPHDRLGHSGRHKRWISRRASALVDDGERIFVDSSTTAFAMMAGLQERRGLTVVTNGIDVARAASENPYTRVELVGGVVRPGRASVVGRATEASVSGQRFDKAFVSCVAYAFEEGLLEESAEEAGVKRAATAAATDVIALVDSAKLASAAGAFSFAEPASISQMLVDDAAMPEHIDGLLAAGIPVSVCGDGRTALMRPPRRDGKRWRIGFANLTEDHPFPFAVRLGLERAAARAGSVDLLIADNAMNGPSALANVDWFIRNGADLVIEYQYHVSYGPVIMARFREAAIPVVAVDIPMPGATYFGVDNYRAGLIGGEAAAGAVLDRWGGAVDHVISLELGLAGRTPAERMQGQLDALRARTAVSDDHVTHIDCGIGRAEACNSVADALHTLSDQARIVVLAATDEAALGAIDAIEQAGRRELTVVTGQGADAGARAAMLTPGSPLVGAVSYVPEQYGPQLIHLALAILQREPVPPAVFITHELVTAASIRSGAHDGLMRADRTEDPGAADARRFMASTTRTSDRMERREVAPQHAQGTT